MKSTGDFLFVIGFMIIVSVVITCIVGPAEADTIEIPTYFIVSPWAGGVWIQHIPMPVAEEPPWWHLDVGGLVDLWWWKRF